METTHTLPKTVIGQYGYGILKTAISTKEIRDIKRELTVRPFVPPGAPVRPDPFSVYMESPQRLWVPREWGVSKYGPPEVCRIGEGVDCSEHLAFKGEMREKQLGILRDWKTVISSKKPEGRILTVPCGYGKTVMSLWCASQVGRKTLIVVHKEFLMNQFRSEIERFLPSARVGKIQGSVCDVEDKDIVIGMLQSLVSKEYPKEMFQQFGMVIFDECHHLAAEVFSQVLMFLGCWRMLGLSATPDRKDNLSKVFHWHLGDFLAKIVDRGRETLQVQKIFHRPLVEGTGGMDLEEYLAEPIGHGDQVMLPRLVTRICENSDRNRMILNIIVSLIKTEGRRVLMLSDRKSQLKWMYERVFTGKYGLMDEVGYYVGGMKEADLAISSKKSLVLGTYAMASEGMNVPELDTLILASPKSDIVQSVGRILRKKQEDREKVPLVIDIIDPHDSLIRQSKKRETFYNGCEYDVQEGHWIGNAFVVKVNTKKRAPRKSKKGGDGSYGADREDVEEAENVVCLISD